MRALFRVFRAHRVRYLVVGGQAAILYGASHFFQDLDLWIDPGDDNVRRFPDALQALHARVHKLTPPVTRAFIDRGHGFHFVIPLREGPVYLDMMGRPPGVGGFAEAWRRAEIMPTPWGRLAVVSIPELVEMKKTNRPVGARAQKLQAAGRRYWFTRIDELRRLRSGGGLLPEGTPVTWEISSARRP